MTWGRRTKSSDELLLYNLESFKCQTMQASIDFSVVKEQRKNDQKSPIHSKKHLSAQTNSYCDYLR